MPVRGLLQPRMHVLTARMHQVLRACLSCDVELLIVDVDGDDGRTSECRRRYSAETDTAAAVDRDHISGLHPPARDGMAADGKRLDQA